MNSFVSGLSCVNIHQIGYEPFVVRQEPGLLEIIGSRQVRAFLPGIRAIVEHNAVFVEYLDGDPMPCFARPILIDSTSDRLRGLRWIRSRSGQSGDDPDILMTRGR